MIADIQQVRERLKDIAKGLTGEYGPVPLDIGDQARTLLSEARHNAAPNVRQAAFAGVLNLLPRFLKERDSRETAHLAAFTLRHAPSPEIQGIGVMQVLDLMNPGNAVDFSRALLNDDMPGEMRGLVVNKSLGLFKKTMKLSPSEGTTLAEILLDETRKSGDLAGFSDISVAVLEMAGIVMRKGDASERRKFFSLLAKETPDTATLLEDTARMAVEANTNRLIGKGIIIGIFLAAATQVPLRYYTDFGNAPAPVPAPQAAPAGLGR